MCNKIFDLLSCSEVCRNSPKIYSLSAGQYGVRFRDDRKPFSCPLCPHDLLQFELRMSCATRTCLHPRLDGIFSCLPIYQSRIWGGAYAADRCAATPKRHILYSNDLCLLSRLATAAGHLTGEELSSLSGEKLVCKRKRDDGTESWTGNKETMTKSQSGPQLSQKKMTCMQVSNVRIFFFELRAYHHRFGVHLANLKREMGGDLWQARKAPPHLAHWKCDCVCL